MTPVPAFDLTGRVALITGASSGFGARFAKLLAAAGAKVVIGARRVDRLEALRLEIAAAGGEALAVPLDVADEASIIAAYNAAEARFGTVDTIIANAGVSADKLSVSLGIDDIDALLSINLKGVFLTAREGAKRLIAAGSAQHGRGRVILIGSITGDKVYTGTSLYAATKAGVKQLGRVMAREWTRKGINVNSILPGYIETEMTGPLVGTGMGEALIGTFPRRRFCPIDALDVPLLYFASDLSQAVTGAFLTVDDGQSL